MAGHSLSQLPSSFITVDLFLFELTLMTAAGHRGHMCFDKRALSALAVDEVNGRDCLHLLRSLVRQPHLVMFEVLSLVVALFGACLVGSSPV